MINMTWVGCINDINNNLILCQCKQYEDNLSELNDELNSVKSRIDGIDMWHSKKKLANPDEMI